MSLFKIIVTFYLNLKKKIELVDTRRCHIKISYRSNTLNISLTPNENYKGKSKTLKLKYNTLGAKYMVPLLNSNIIVDSI